MGVSMFLRYYNLGGINMHIRLSYFDVRQRLAQVPNLAPEPGIGPGRRPGP